MTTKNNSNVVFPPEIFIIGAPKCGTTSLAKLLETHPEITLSDPKETDYLTRNYPKGIHWYQSRFAVSDETRFLIDASTSYSAFTEQQIGSNTAKRLFEFNPAAKIIYVVRDPIQRAWSSYWHSVRAGEEKRDFIEVMAIENCFHIIAGKFYACLVNYQKYFDKKNICIISFTELVKDPDKATMKVLEFIGADTKQYRKPKSDNQHKNISFQWNSSAGWLIKIFGVRRIKKIIQLTKRIVPVFLFEALKKIVSKPIPKIKHEDACSLLSFYEDDAENFYTETGVDVRTGAWWDAGKRD